MLTLHDHIKLDKKTITSPNLAGKFGKDDLTRIGGYVKEGYLRDKASRANWERRMQAGMDLALQLQKDKTFPWVNASNVAFPLITIATLQFHSRAYPALIGGTEVVKMRVVGLDEDGSQTARADRIGKHMSYQVMEQDQSWEEQHDRLLINVPVVGCAFIKTRHSPLRDSNVSELVFAKDLVMDYFSKSVETAARKTQVILKHRNEIYEQVKLEAYQDVLGDSWYTGHATVSEDHQNEDARKGLTPPTNDADTPFTCLEQHCFLDLDDDGYAEPYIVLIEEDSETVLRITARFEREEDITRNSKGEVISIRPAEYFTKYGFIPSPDGGIYDLGFGVLLGPLNESVNTLVNQLIDSGTMSSLGGGFLGRGAKIRGGGSSFAPMEWKRVDSTGDDLRKSLVPLITKEPSPVLFQLLGLLIDYTNRISGATEMLAGQNPGQNTAATTSDHMVEQGMKIYAAIFKRTWRSMKEEFKKLFILNAINLPTTSRLATGQIALREDYLTDPNRICPVADPNVVSDSIQMQRALFIAQRAMAAPGYDPAAVEKHLLRTANIPEWQSLYIGVDKTGPLKNPKVQIEEMKIALAEKKLAQQRDEFTIRMMEEHELMEAQIAQLGALAEKLLAEAKGVDSGHQIAMINTMIGASRARKEGLHKQIELLLKAGKVENEHELAKHTISGVAGKPGNGGAAKTTPQLGGG